MTHRTMMTLAAAALLATAPLAAQQPGVGLDAAAPSGELVILIGPVDIPLPTMAGMSGDEHEGHGDHHGAMVMPPVGEIVVPFDAWVYGFRYEVVDAQGNAVPSAVLHHLNVIDPSQRDLFLPISYRVAAVGSETGPLRLPRLVFGHPLRAGQRLVVSAMLHNPTDAAYAGVTVRFIFDYVKTGRPWPLFPVYTFQMDVRFPAGDKDFDLPPGESVWSWEGSPAIAGRILGVGGHLHRYADRLTLEDVTAGETIWVGKPILDADSQLVGVTVGRLYRTLGVEVRPDHVYRATVVYDNPTGAVIPKGGMGLIAGVFMPSGPWPRAPYADALYQLDRKHYLREVRGVLSEIAGDSTGAASASHDHSAHSH